MVSLEDMLKEEGEGKKTDEKKTESAIGKGILNKIWTAESPSKKVAEYTNHALNWDKKESTGKIIRGLEGMTGNLDRAVIDFTVGIIQKIGELFKAIGEKKA